MYRSWSSALSYLRSFSIELKFLSKESAAWHALSHRSKLKLNISYFRLARSKFQLPPFERVFGLLVLSSKVHHRASDRQNSILHMIALGSCGLQFAFLQLLFRDTTLVLLASVFSIPNSSVMTTLWCKFDAGLGLLHFAASNSV